MSAAFVAGCSGGVEFDSEVVVLASAEGALCELDPSWSGVVVFLGALDVVFFQKFDKHGSVKPKVMPTGNAASTKLNAMV